LFVFGIPGLPESPALPPAEGPAGPTVAVTPPAEGSLTLVVTLSGGPVPAGGAALTAVPPEVAPTAAAAPVPSAGSVVVAAAAGAPPADPAGDSGGEEGREQVADADPRRPAAEGLDVKEKLRDIDLYQPTPNPDRPGPISRQQAARDQVLIALAPVAAEAAPPAGAASGRLWAGAAEVVRAVVADMEVAAPSKVEAVDAVFVLPPSQWDGERSRLLALAGLALWPWLDCRPDAERRSRREQERKKAQSRPNG
jgi:hypothetical protein